VTAFSPNDISGLRKPEASFPPALRFAMRDESPLRCGMHCVASESARCNPWQSPGLAGSERSSALADGH